MAFAPVLATIRFRSAISSAGVFPRVPLAL